MNAKCGADYDADLKVELPKERPIGQSAPLEPPKGWTLCLADASEYQPTNKEHPAYTYAMSHGPKLDFSLLPPEVIQVMVPVLYVDDAEGKSLRHVQLEPRVVRDGHLPTEESSLLALSPEHFLVQQPYTSKLFNAGCYEEVLHFPWHYSPLHRRLFLQARARIETEQAVQALKTLFKHYCFNEELWRMEEILARYLPFDLEEHPEVEVLRELMDKQVKQLREGEGTQRRITPQAIARHYGSTSPVAGIDEEYVKSAGMSLPIRFGWLIRECKKEGYKKVAEWGSVEGISLFHLIAHAPDIDWFGFETKPEAVRRGNELAAKCGVQGFALGAMEHFGGGDLTDFDAVALFEVLEHNTPAGGAAIVHQCLTALRPGGTLYITTPDGNWSAFDEHCRDLTLMKDHINSYTPSRMVRFLEECLRAVVEKYEVLDVQSVENPTLHEYNKWVFAKVRKR